jgi:beta-glucosidase
LHFAFHVVFAFFVYFVVISIFHSFNMYSKLFLLSSLATTAFAAPGDGDWGPAYTKAKAALAKLTNANKAALASGIGWEKGPCVGNTVAISSIGYPQFCAQDAPLGYGQPLG